MRCGRFPTSTCSSKIPTCYGPLPWFCLANPQVQHARAALARRHLPSAPTPPLSPSSFFRWACCGQRAARANGNGFVATFFGRAEEQSATRLRTHPFRPRSLCLVRERKLAACPICPPPLSLHLQIWAPAAIPVSHRHADSTTRQREREREEGGLISQVRSHTHPHTHTRTFSLFLSSQSAITLRVAAAQRNSQATRRVLRSSGCCCALWVCAVQARSPFSLPFSSPLSRLRCPNPSWLSLPPSLLSLALALSLASPSLSSPHFRSFASLFCSFSLHPTITLFSSVWTTG